jgi:stage III sporulation protein AE
MFFSLFATGTNVMEKEYKEQFEIIGALELEKNIPEEVKKILENLKFNIYKPSASAIEPKAIFEILINNFRKKMEIPIGTIMPCLGISILCALISAVSSSENLKTTEIFRLSCACAASAVIILPISETISFSAATIKCASNFILCFAPVLAGASICSGMPISAAVSSSSVIFASQTAFAWAQNFIEPIMKIFLGTSILTAISPRIGFKKLFDVLYSNLKRLLIGISSVFAIIVSIQKTISVPSDALACKGLKLAVGLTPIIGSSIGDAAEAIRSCAMILKSGIGAFGIISVFLVFMPSVIECCVWIFSLGICEFLSVILEADEISGLIKSCRKTISAMLAIVIFCFFAFFTAAGGLTGL